MVSSPDHRANTGQRHPVIRNPWRNRCYNDGTAMDLFDLGADMVIYPAGGLRGGVAGLDGEVGGAFAGGDPLDFGEVVHGSGAATL
jgi:hypothetical protein